MYRAGRQSVRERIVAAEVMKLERQQAERRAGDRRPYPEQSRSRIPGAHSGKHLL
jgi:hypothetical protein